MAPQRTSAPLGQVKDRKVKQVLLGEGSTVMWRVNGEGEGGGLYFIRLYETRTMKPDEMVLSRRERGQGREMVGANLPKMHCDIYVCHKEISCTANIS
jgi:hypothetical protein